MSAVTFSSWSLTENVLPNVQIQDYHFSFVLYVYETWASLSEGRG
jgi:hypothetical protein